MVRVVRVEADVAYRVLGVDHHGCLSFISTLTTGVTALSLEAQAISTYGTR